MREMLDEYLLEVVVFVVVFKILSVVDGVLEIKKIKVIEYFKKKKVK